MPTPNYTVTGTLDNLIGGMDANGYLIFTLVNYGNDVPRVSGTAIVVQPATKVIAASGTFSVTLWGNDQITPGGNLLPTQTYYTVEIFSDSGQKLTAAAYRFVGTGTFDLSTQVPLSASPPISTPTGFPVFIPVVDKFITGFDGQQFFASTIGSTRFVEQFSNIQAAITDAGTTGNVLIPSAYVGTDVYTNPNNVQIHDLRGKPDRDRTFVNALVDCGLKGDGVTNDGPAIQACIDANQGKRIVFPKTQAVGSCDYSIGSTTIQPKGHGQIIEGQGSGWAGQGTRFCKLVADGNTAIDIIHANCQNCALKNLHLTGPQSWSSVTLTQNIPPCTPPNGQSYSAGVVCDTTASDGLLVEAAFTTLENIYVENFGRTGIFITSNFGGFPDNFNLINVTSNNNRGDGLYCKGGDANAGSSLQFHAYNNMMYGVDDQGFLGNSHYSPQVTGNHAAGTTLGTTFAITAASRTTNVVTLTAAGHNVSAGNVVVVAGVTDGTFNGTFSITSVASNTITYAQTAGNASSSGGTVRLTSNNEFYAATAIVGGSYNMQGAAAWNTLYSPYCEGSQNPITGNSKLVIIGGDQGCGIDYTNSPLIIGRSLLDSPIANANFATGTAGFSFLTPTNAGGLLFNFVGGKTTDTSIEHRFMGANTLTTYWDWVHTVGGTQGGTTQTLALYRGTNGSNTRIALLGPGVGGLNLFNDEGTSTRFNNAAGSSGNIEFYSAGGGQLIHDFLSNGQYAMTPGANNIDILSLKRFTDTAPTGNFQNFKSTAGASLWQVDITGTLAAGAVPSARLTNTTGSGNAVLATSPTVSNPAIAGTITATIGGGSNIIYGASALLGCSTCDFNVALGTSALQSLSLLATGKQNVGIGYGVASFTSSSVDNVVIGYQAWNNAASGNRNIILGSSGGQNATSGNNNIFIGYKAGQFSPVAISGNAVLGDSTSAPITDLYLNGSHSNGATPGVTTIHGAGASGASSNIAGGTLQIAGGVGTGSGVGGDIVLLTAPSGASAGVQNSLVERLRITTAGAITAAANINAVTGFQYNGTAPTGHVLRGNGTNFIDAQLALSDLSGSVSAAQMPALTGDVTSSAGTVATTVGKVNGGTVAGTNGNFASYGASNQFADSGIAITAVPVFKGTSVSLTNQSAAIGITNILASAPAGLYRMNLYASISQAATTSSSLGVLFSWMDGNTFASYQPINYTGNTLGPAGIDSVFASIVFHSAAAQNITYTTGYASVGATPMKYDLYMVLEKIG